MRLPDGSDRDRPRTYAASAASLPYPTAAIALFGPKALDLTQSRTANYGNYPFAPAHSRK